MRSLLSAAISLALVMTAAAAARPRYGGTALVDVHERVIALDPAELSPASHNATVTANLARLLYDTLVVLDDRGHPLPGLAHTWEADASLRRWQFNIRPEVVFGDGSPLTPAQVCTSLAVSAPGMRCTATTDSITIELEAGDPHLPAELARTWHSIVLRKPNSVPLGSGPFLLSEFTTEGTLRLIANEGHWAGRPFLDKVEVHISRPLRQQATDLELGRIHVSQVRPDQARSAGQRHRVVSSPPDQMLALDFSVTGPAADARIRQALALAIAREPLHAVLLQRQGERADGLTPRWLTGYGFLFNAEPDVARARELHAQAPLKTPLLLIYDADHPLAGALAERVALNARDAGIPLQVMSESATNPSRRADIRLRQVPLPSVNPAVALRVLGAACEPAPTLRSSNVNDLFAAERELLGRHCIVPLLYVPQFHGIGGAVKNWPAQSRGLPLDRVWLEEQR